MARINYFYSLVNFNRCITVSSKKNVVRGLHFQKKFAQHKIIFVLKGIINDFLVDIKKNSRTLKKKFEFVGPICESTDKFLIVKKFQPLKENDLVIICDVGAYGMALASNYNVRPLPAEILIKNSSAQIIKARQKLADLI